MIVTIDATPRLRFHMNSKTLRVTTVEHANGVPYAVHETSAEQFIAIMREIQNEGKKP